MFTKVLVADDLGSINQGVISILDTLGVKEVEKVQYCDDAYLKVKKAILDNKPFDLVITDLSFKADYREQKYASGEDLLKALKIEFPDLKIIVYSVEDRLQKVRTIINKHKADAYVCKGRQGLIELSKAVKKVYKNGVYLSPKVEHALSPKASLEIDDYDVELVNQLSKGLSQDEISIFFKVNNMSPSSLSSIEKRLNRLRIQFKANNAIHLVAIVKDLGLI
ncbi:response regulator [Pontimicrobium sp. SW4]|uniref:Response regulator n=1 Tax=Pontimicrobium sp. SW4 TaxID=3153519 RepID=A0AAU7BW57_9FLAO